MTASQQVQTQYVGIVMRRSWAQAAWRWRRVSFFAAGFLFVVVMYPI